ncbi:MAG: hypothetical protein LBS21_15250 [Clostridiales bacterium]|jgi:hypothetical protein|nr:hypothetical protein [Clostridiales bacterium]
MKNAKLKNKLLQAMYKPKQSGIANAIKKALTEVDKSLNRDSKNENKNSL